MKICRHIKTNGIRCKSPRLNHRDLCYFHARIHGRQDILVQSSTPITALTPQAQPIEIDLPVLEDAESIQVSISILAAALARNRIDPKRAAVLLYALQLAATNVRSINTEPFAAIVRNVTQSDSGPDLAIEEEEEEEEQSDVDIEGQPARQQLCPCMEEKEEEEVEEECDCELVALNASEAASGVVSSPISRIPSSQPHRDEGPCNPLAPTLSRLAA